MITARHHAVAFSLLVVFFACPIPADAAEPLDYQLACVDAGELVSHDDITVARFRSLLSQLSGKYVESPQQIADISVKAKQLLRDEGISEKMLNMMEGLNQVLTQQMPNQRYAEYVATYVTMRKNGNSHGASIEGMRALLNAMDVY
jgi:hypothetical protein